MTKTVVSLARLEKFGALKVTEAAFTLPSLKLSLQQLGDNETSPHSTTSPGDMAS